MALLERLLDDVARWEPRIGKVVELLEELVTGRLGRDGEARVVVVVRRGLVPARVQAADARRQIGALRVRELALRNVDAVVDAVDRLDQLAVELQPERLDLGVALGDTELLGDDVIAKVLVHEARGRELGAVKAAKAKDLGEAALVVVVALLGGVVHAADIDDNVQGVDCGQRVRRGTYAWRGRGCGRGRHP